MSDNKSDGEKQSVQKTKTLKLTDAQVVTMLEALQERAASLYDQRTGYELPAAETARLEAREDAIRELQKLLKSV